MPISFQNDGIGVDWHTSFDRPAIYLDTWAIRHFAESRELGDRFVAAIKSKGGTWMLSSSISEFAVFPKRQFAEQADEFILRVVPNIYFASADTNPSWLEDEQLARPPADIRHMNYFALKFAESGEMDQTFSGLFTMMFDRREEMIIAHEEQANRIVAKLENVRRSADYRARAKISVPDGIRSRTKIVAGELLRELTLNTSARISKNDAADLMHAVDALIYCDFVLLDRHWERRANSLRLRVRESGIKMRVARCFSLRENGIEVFLRELEAFPSKN